MTDEEIDRFVDTYVRYLQWDRLPQELPATKAEAQALLDRFKGRAAENPYLDDVHDLFNWSHDDPELAWRVILKIVDAVKANAQDLRMFGAGDLETFVHVQAVAFCERIEAEIRSNAAFRKAFESVYIGGGTPADVGRRINAALRDAGAPPESIIDWWG